MENNLKLCPDKFCRTCLTENSDMKSLTATIVGATRSLLDVLNFVADINVFVDNPLPKHICSNCESILVTADAFKQRCLQSEAILTQQFETSTYRQIGDNIPNTTLVKDENGLQIGVLDPNAQAAGSKSTIKSSDGSFNEIFETFSHSVVKVKEISGSSPSKPSNELFDDKKDILDKPNVVQIVKEENNIDFNTQNDDSFDFGVTVTYEPESIKLKKEKASFKEVRIFSCSCGTVFNTKNDYRLHLHARNCNGYKKSTKIKVAAKDPDFSEKSNKKKPVVCPLCNAEFSTVKARKIHQKSHNKSNEDSGNFECTICMRKFNRKSSWTNHIKHHDMKSGIKFTCETCKREFQHKAHLDNHILAVHSREKGYTCDICSTNFATLDSLEIHKDSHKIEKKHRCKICNKAFYMLSSLNDHLRVHTGEKPYLCSICGRGFSQKTNLAQHVRRHQGLKPFKCEHCDRRFVSKGELVAHTRKHSGAHPFVCDDCGSGFTTSSSLVKHRRVHTGERPYACDLCPRKFAASGTLKNHRRTHTGEKPFQCSYCEKAFVQRQDLVSHIRGHTGERPYTCGCGQAFRKASSLKAHVRLHGKEPQRDLSLLLQPAAILTDLNTSLAPSNV